MRNLKRVLSLALALVMVLGMMVITTSAATFTDAEEITYTEAVDVMSALGILKGYEAANGTYTFNPKGTLNRQEAAKIIAFVCLGTEADDYLTGSTKSFDDVDVDHWAAKYIAFCKNAKIANGVNDAQTLFNPTGTLTVAQFAKMLLVAAGIEGEYTGPAWENNVKDAFENNAVLKATGIKISTANITREEACHMALAAMMAGGTTTKYYYVVDESVTDVDDALATEIHGKFTTPTDAYVLANVMDDVQVLVDTETSGTLLKEVYGWNYKPTGVSDDFGRPAVSYDNGKTGAKKVELLFPAEADYTYTVTGQNDTELADIAAKLELEVDSATMTTATKGDTVELFLNADGEIATAVKLHTALNQISKVVKTKDEDAKYTYDISLKNGSTYTDVQLEDFDVETMVKDTYITLVASEKANTTVAIVAVAEYITGKQTATGSNYIKVDGEKKFYVPGAVNDVNYADTYMFFVDANGLIIGNEVVEEAEEETNIFYVTADNFSAGDDTFTTDVAQLAVMYLDGTTAILDMVVNQAGKVAIGGTTANTLVSNADAAITEGAFFEYALNDKGDVAYIKAVSTEVAAKGYVAGTSVTFTDDNSTIAWGNGKFYADENTVVTTIDEEGKVATITGYKNIPEQAFTSVDVLVKYVGDDVSVIYVVGDAFDAAGSKAVVGVKISVGDTYYNATKKAYFTEVVYNVAGEDVTYTVARAVNEETGALIALTTPDFAEIVVTEGVAVLDDATDESGESMYGKTNKAVEKVTTTYVVIGDTVVPFASDVVYYDVTNVAKNGVVADDEVVVGDIINYTLNKDNEIDAIYITYEAQEDGLISIDLSSAAGQAYYKDVLQLIPGVLNNVMLNKPGSYALFQHTRPAGTNEISITVKDADGNAVEGWNPNTFNSSVNGTVGFLWYLEAGDPDSMAYTVEIKVNGDIVLTGACELTK